MLQNESWLIYCATWDFPVMLRKQKKSSDRVSLGVCASCARKIRIAVTSNTLMDFVRPGFK